MVLLFINDKVSSITTPVKELVAFKRIKLEANESKAISFKLSENDFELLNKKFEWEVEPGVFELIVGVGDESLSGEFILK